MRLPKQISFHILSRLSGGVLKLAFFVLASRALTVDALGTFIYTIAVVTIFVTLVRYGFKDYTVALLIRGGSVSQVLLSAVLASAIVSLLSFPVLYLFTRDLGNLAILSVTVSASLGAFFVIGAKYDLELRQHVVAATELSVNIGFFILKLLTLYVTGNLPLLIFLAAIELSSARTILFFVQAVRGSFRISDISISDCIYLLRKAFPLMIGSMSVIVYMRTDQIMLGQLLGYSTVATYSVASRIVEFAMMVPLVINNYLVPKLLHGIGEEVISNARRLEARFVFMLHISMFASLLVVIVVSFLASGLILFLFGAEYQGAIPLLLLLVWCVPLSCLGTVSSRHALILGKNTDLMLRSGAAAIANIAFNFLLIPIWGGFGAALATLASYLISGIVVDVTLNRLRYAYTVKQRALSIRRMKKTLRSVFRAAA